MKPFALVVGIFLIAKIGVEFSLWGFIWFMVGAQLIHYSQDR